LTEQLTMLSRAEHLPLKFIYGTSSAIQILSCCSILARLIR